MNAPGMLQRVLAAQWEQLPAALRAHHQAGTNRDVGALDIEYPRLMQFYLNALRMLGALVNRRGQALSTTVEKYRVGESQVWQRRINFPGGKTILFKSRWVYAGGNELIEYVNPVLGLRMAVRVDRGALYYEGRHYVLRLGKLLLPIPEWLVLGHTTIVETALDAEHFVMDFRLRHPLFGQIFRYAGRFKTVEGDGVVRG
jgi:hypothetical protein